MAGARVPLGQRYRVTWCNRFCFTLSYLPHVKCITIRLWLGRLALKIAGDEFLIPRRCGWRGRVYPLDRGTVSHGATGSVSP